MSSNNLFLAKSLGSSNETYDIENLLSCKKLKVNVQNGHVNMINSKIQCMLILSAGENSVVFKAGSEAENIYIKNSMPLQLRIDKNADAKIRNLYISPQTASLDRSLVKLDGNFDFTNIFLTNSVILSTGQNFKVKVPIRVVNCSCTSTIKLKGYFSESAPIKLLTPSIIYGGEDAHPIGAEILVSSSSQNDLFMFKGNLSLCSLTVEKSCKIRCFCQINNLVVGCGDGKTNLYLNADSAFNHIDIYSPVEIEGEEASLIKFINSSRLHDHGSIHVKGITSETKFKNGEGICHVSLSRPGFYKLSAKLVTEDGFVELNPKFYVKVLH